MLRRHRQIHARPVHCKRRANELNAILDAINTINAPRLQRPRVQLVDQARDDKGHFWLAILGRVLEWAAKDALPSRQFQIAYF